MFFTSCWVALEYFQQVSELMIIGKVVKIVRLCFLLDILTLICLFIGADY